MTLRFEDSALIIRDETGVVKFNSEEKLFTVTDYVSSQDVGAVAISSRSVTATAFSAPYTNTETDYFISSVHPMADIVFGMVQFGPAGAGEDNSEISGKWRQVNGTHMFVHNSTGEQLTGVGRTDRHFMSMLGLFTFIIDGGSLYLRDRFIGRAWAGPWTTTVPAFTVNFRLCCGTFV